MLSMLPPNALFVTFPLWSVMLVLVSHCLYAYLLAKYSHHWLVQFHQVIDLTPIEQGCAGFHQGSGKGSAVVHPVPRLVRALLVKYLFDLSYRETEEKIDRDLLVKWFVGYGLFESPPDHTTLQRFEIWVLSHRPRLFFDEILRQIDALCPQDRRRMQLVDTYAMLARGAKSSIIHLMRGASRKLLQALEAADPQRHAALCAQLDLMALFGPEDEKPTAFLTPQERDARLQQVASQALRLHAWLKESLDAQRPPYLPLETQAPLRLWLGHLHKIIHDETCVTPQPAPDGAEVTIRERPHGQKGSYRIGALNDTTATFRNHAADKPAELGFNVSVLTTTHFVRETQVDTGAQPDPVALPPMLHSQKEHHGFFPDKLGGDRAYGTGKVRAAVEAVTHGQTQVVALLPDYDKRTERFTPTDFTLADDGAALTCPNGVTTYKHYLSQDRDGVDFRFTAKMCRGCPLAARCRGEDAKPQAHRMVFISHYRDQVQAALAYNATEQFKQEIKLRAHVERIIYNLTNLHGGRRAHSTGLPKADFQTKMVATAFNIRQLLRLVARRPQAAAV
jgi:transposase